MESLLDIYLQHENDLQQLRTSVETLKLFNEPCFDEVRPSVISVEDMKIRKKTIINDIKLSNETVDEVTLFISDINI